MSGPLTFDTVGGLFRDSGELPVATGRVTTVDLEKVENVDSAGLALLLEWQSRAKRQGHELDFRNAPRDLLRLAALAEASDLLGLLPVPELAHDQLD
jgi:phospholipid transport system transporter-binding protein